MAETTASASAAVLIIGTKTPIAPRSKDRWIENKSKGGTLTIGIVFVPLMAMSICST